MPHKASNKAGCWRKGQASKHTQDSGFLCKTWWSSEDALQRLQCFFRLYASHDCINKQFRWAEGRWI